MTFELQTSFHLCAASQKGKIPRNCFLLQRPEISQKQMTQFVECLLIIILGTRQPGSFPRNVTKVLAPKSCFQRRKLSPFLLFDWGFCRQNYLRIGLIGWQRVPILEIFRECFVQQKIPLNSYGDQHVALPREKPGKESTSYNVVSSRCPQGTLLLRHVHAASFKRSLYWRGSYIFSNQKTRNLQLNLDARHW